MNTTPSAESAQAFTRTPRMMREVEPVTGLTLMLAGSFVAPVGIVVVLPLKLWLEHGPALVRAAPVARVEVVDAPCVPVWHHERPQGHEWAYGWQSCVPGAHPEANTIPARLFALLTGGDRPREDTVSYPTERAAIAALSQACLAWARAVTPSA